MLRVIGVSQADASARRAPASPAFRLIARPFRALGRVGGTEGEGGVYWAP
jgi:hypothetical protein